MASCFFSCLEFGGVCFFEGDRIREKRSRFGQGLIILNTTPYFQEQCSAYMPVLDLPTL